MAISLNLESIANPERVKAYDPIEAYYALIYRFKADGSLATEYFETTEIEAVVFDMHDRELRRERKRVSDGAVVSQ